MALICGAGPSGLAAAIMLHQQGWREIVLVERRASHDAFERAKAFNYQLDGRGQKMLASIGLDQQAVKDYGIANTQFILNSFGPDGIEKSFTVPFVLKDKQTAYWMTRSALITMLHKRLEAVNSDGRIRQLYGYSFDGIEKDDTGVGAVVTDKALGKTETIYPKLILGCDGVNSNLRKNLASIDGTSNSDFEMVVTPSPSSSLLFKVIKLPKIINVNGHENTLSDHKKSYVFTSAYKAFHYRLSLFSLPVARAEEPRSANIILPSDHNFWKIKTANALTAFLITAFPQLDIYQIFPPEEVEEFLNLKTGKFPDPQYSPRVHEEIEAGGTITSCVLLGDAAHAFPPDLGLGVNSALEDVYLLGQELAMSEGALSAAAARYESARLPEIRALVRLVRKVFPHQYNHIPWRFKISMVKFFAQLGLSKISGGLIDEPGFKLSQNEKIGYRELERRILKTDITLYVMLTLIVSVIVYLVSRII